MSAITPMQAWIPAVATITSVEGSRTPALTRQVCEQFDVEHAERYRKGHDPAAPGATYCNAYLWDVTRAMNCEIPHWFDASGNVAKVGGGSEMSANKAFDWLAQLGEAHGWHQADLNQATIAAARGEPVVFVWKNPTGRSGHVGFGVTGPNGELLLCQAGETNFIGKIPAHGFGNLPFKVYTHK